MSSVIPEKQPSPELGALIEKFVGAVRKQVLSRRLYIREGNTEMGIQKLSQLYLYPVHSFWNERPRPISLSLLEGKGQAKEEIHR